MNCLSHGYSKASKIFSSYRSFHDVIGFKLRIQTRIVKLLFHKHLQNCASQWNVAGKFLLQFDDTRSKIRVYFLKLAKRAAKRKALPIRMIHGKSFQSTELLITGKCQQLFTSKIPQTDSTKRCVTPVKLTSYQIQVEHELILINCYTLHVLMASLILQDKTLFIS